MTPGTPLPPDRGASALVAALAGVIVLLAGIALLASHAVESFREDGGLWGSSEVVSDQVTDSITESGLGFPELDLNDPLLRHRKIVVSEGMNERTARGVVRKLLYLNAEDPKLPIDLYLSTAGGWFDSAFAIVAAMRLIDAPVNTIAIGGCHSSGAVVLISGTGRRFAAPDALISIHANLSDDTGAWAQGTRDRTRVDRALRNGTTLPTSWFPLRGENIYYLTPEEALGFGVIDEILPRRAARERKP